jgi:hypothetical protein
VEALPGALLLQGQGHRAIPLTWTMVGPFGSMGTLQRHARLRTTAGSALSARRQRRQYQMR